jgi:hypothetical protein
MRRIFAVLLMVLLEMPLFSQNALTIYQKNGELFRIGFEKKPIVTYTDNELVVTTTKLEFQCELDKIAKFTFNDIEDAVPNIKSDATKAGISVDEYTIRITGAKPNVTVRLIASDGKLLHSYMTNQNGNVTFSIADLTEETYIISSDSLTVKILKK